MGHDELNILERDELRGRGVRWPARAVVTAGMPYGNKHLHFGHVGGVFVPADCYARFLRDRIGRENVLFVSGTDCFGSPIDEGFRKKVEAGEFSGTIEQYVQENHDSQKATLDAYGISLDVFEGSGIGSCGYEHQEFSNYVLRRLHENGFLSKQETMQFYDAQAKMFLNGRQVEGHCPVQGCKSEHAYADECDLGHQYAPADLISPTSTVTGTVPEMRPVANWYFDLPRFMGFLEREVARWKGDARVRKIVPEAVEAFLAPPIAFIKNECMGEYREVCSQLPKHVCRLPEGNKASFEIEFQSIEDRDAARPILQAAGVRFRTGKTLVPFRITGNAAWGVPAPDLDGKTEGLTVWCWPESLWAPISFTIAALEERGLPHDSWRAFWCSDDAQVYQFIGQDNIYFYGVAQPALWQAMQGGGELHDEPVGDDLRQSILVANHHLLLGKVKASSSGSVKPPSADELLEHYTPEQLRAHWLALGLDQKSVGFKPKPYDPDPQKRDDPRVADPVLKEGALLTKVFNRLARSCLYAAKNDFEGYMPLGPVSSDPLDRALRTLAEYDARMERTEFHAIMSMMDDFIRYSNKYWSDNIKRAQNEDDAVLRRQTVVDSFYLLRICTLLMHPIVPRGCEKICDYLSFEFDDFFSWNYDFESMEELCGAAELQEGRHRVRELPPRTDFFEMHRSQRKN